MLFGCLFCCFPYAGWYCTLYLWFYRFKKPSMVKKLVKKLAKNLAGVCQEGFCLNLHEAFGRLRDPLPTPAGFMCCPSFLLFSELLNRFVIVLQCVFFFQCQLCGFDYLSLLSFFKFSCFLVHRFPHVFMCIVSFLCFQSCCFVFICFPFHLS